MKTKDAKLLILAVILAVIFSLWSSFFNTAYEVFVSQMRMKSLMKSQNKPILDIGEDFIIAQQCPWARYL